MLVTCNFQYPYLILTYLNLEELVAKHSGF